MQDVPQECDPSGVQMTNDSYLIKRGNVYWYKRRYPSHVHASLGQYHRVSLKTRDITVARKRRDLENANFHDAVAQEERGTKAHDDITLVDIARKVREWYQKYPSTEVYNPELEGYEAAPNPKVEEVVELFRSLVEEMDPQRLEPETRIAEELVRLPVDVPLLGDLIRKYESELRGELTEQTTNERLAYIRKWADRVGESTPITALLDPEDAYRFVKDSIIDADLAKVTKQKRLNSLVMFFDWLIGHRVVGSNPFSGIQLVTVKGRKGKNEDKRKAWTDEELEKLLKGLVEASRTGRIPSARRNAQKLHSMVLIGMYTGMRIDEIASLRKEDCEGDVFTIRNGKTAAAIRTVPIHPKLKPLVKKLLKESTDDYLIPELTPGGPDNKRSWQIQKAFGRMKTNLGFPPELVFHSLRKSLISKLHEVGVPLMLAKTIVGHKLNDLTYGHYSDAELLEERRKYLKKVGYEVAPEVLKGST